MKIDGIEVNECNSFLAKLMGFMFKKNFSYGLKLRCNGIHTFFMFENIDVVLTDKNDNVLFVFENLKPNRIILPKKNVYYTYEFPSGSIKKKQVMFPMQDKH